MLHRGTKDCHSGAGAPARLLIAFNTGHYQAIDVSLWLSANPDYLLAANFGVTQSVIDRLPRRRVFIAGKGGPEK
jgi:oxalate decarboxylase